MHSIKVIYISNYLYRHAARFEFSKSVMKIRSLRHVTGHCSGSPPIDTALVQR